MNTFTKLLVLKSSAHKNFGYILSIEHRNTSLKSNPETPLARLCPIIELVLTFTFMLFMKPSPHRTLSGTTTRCTHQTRHDHIVIWYTRFNDAR